MAPQRQRDDRQSRNPDTRPCRGQDPSDAGASLGTSEAELIFRKGLRTVGGLLVLASIGAWVGAVHRFGGIRVVIPDEVYRSPQLDPAALQKAFEDLGIRSVLNLRGRGHGRTWFADERSACEQSGVAHVTVTFSIDEWPPRPVTLKFLETLDTLESPLLMHCNRGVDRTGWAGAVVVLATDGSLEEAGRQLSPSSGHFCLRAKCPQHLFLASYRRWLNGYEKSHSGPVFRRWVEEVYCPDAWNAELKSVGAGLPMKSVAGEEVALSIEVVNRGRIAWPHGPSPTRLGFRLIGPLPSLPPGSVGNFLDRDAEISDLGRAESDGRSINPGETRVFGAKIRMPLDPGFYLIQADMVMEQVHWFSEMGWPGLIWQMEVVEHS